MGETGGKLTEELEKGTVETAEIVTATGRDCPHTPVL